MDNNELDFTLREVEETEIFQGVGSEECEDPEESNDSTELLVVDDKVSFGKIARDEESYRKNEIKSQLQPIVQETTKRAVTEAVKYQQDKLKLEVHEVLQDEVGYRLSKYEKRRRRRRLKENLSTAVKVFILLGVIGVILSNASIRSRVQIVTRNAWNYVESLIAGESTSSNSVVDSFLQSLGVELNDINTTEVVIEQGDEQNEVREY